MRKINVKKIKTNIPGNAFISRIEGLVGDVDNVVLEGYFTNMKVYETNATMTVVSDFTDKTGTIKTLLFGNRNKEFKNIIENIIMRHTYRIQGNVALLNNDLDEYTYLKDLNNTKEICITALDDLSSIKLFGEDIVKLYEYDVLKSYNFIKNNTNYLDELLIEDIKDIMFSANKDIIVLLNNGNVLINGKMLFKNINVLIFVSGLSILGISNDNEIIPLIGDEYSYRCLNNNNYKYKKIIANPLIIVALTYENVVVVYGTVCDSLINNERLINVDDIGYNEKTDDIVIIKNKKVYSLFYENDYSLEKDKIEFGDNEKIIIIK